MIALSGFGDVDRAALGPGGLRRACGRARGRGLRGGALSGGLAGSWARAREGAGRVLRPAAWAAGVPGENTRAERNSAAAAHARNGARMRSRFCQSCCYFIINFRLFPEGAREVRPPVPRRSKARPGLRYGKAQNKTPAPAGCRCRGFVLLFASAAANAASPNMSC